MSTQHEFMYVHFMTRFPLFLSYAMIAMRNACMML